MTLVWSSSTGALTLQSPTANDPLLDLNTQPSLDLQFAASKTLDDRVSGQNLITFSRSTTGTYVGSDGLIKTTPVNLKTNSEEVDTFDKTEVTVTANQFAAPNGTLTADRVDITTANSIHHVTVGVGVFNAVSSTTSVYVKGISNVTQVQLRASVFGGRASAVFDLVNVTSEVFRASNVTFADSSITPVGDDWYRISLTFTTTTGVYPRAVFLSFTDGNADPEVDKNGQEFVGTNESMAVWGAQVEEGLVMNDYIPTTSTISGAPRFDHDPATGESLGLLIEEARTNLLTDSVDGATPGSQTTKTSNFETLGELSLNKFEVNAGETIARANYKEVIASASGEHTFSVYLKLVPNVNRTVRVAVERFAGFSLKYVDINCDTLQVTDTTSNYTNYSVQDLGNGLVRVSMVIEVFTDLIGRAFIVAEGTWSPGEYFLAGGYQFEAGSFPTSYIPTSGTAVTRAADVAEITGTNFSSWYNHSEGAFVVEFSAQDFGYDSDGKAFTVSMQFGNNGFLHISKRRGSAQLLIARYADGVVLSSPGIDWSNFQKSALVYNSADYTLVVNGSTVGTTASTSVNAAINTMFIGARHSVGNLLNGCIKRLTYYPYRLPDATLQEITS